MISRSVPLPVKNEARCEVRGARCEGGQRMDGGWTEDGPRVDGGWAEGRHWTEGSEAVELGGDAL